MAAGAARRRAGPLALLALAACLLAALAPVSAQTDALSNSVGCITQGIIPKCESGACATRNIQGVARWVCLRCLANYEPVVDGSGQDNIIQCVCPKGFYEAAANATACTKCPANAFCPGGDKVENPTSRGLPMQCGPNMVTRSDGSRSQADCVSPAGYAQTAPNVATPCNRSEYSPPFNRLARCLRCQSGLEEARNSTLTDGQRTSKRAVCMLPPRQVHEPGPGAAVPAGLLPRELCGLRLAERHAVHALPPRHHHRRRRRAAGRAVQPRGARLRHRRRQQRDRAPEHPPAAHQHQQRRAAPGLRVRLWLLQPQRLLRPVPQQHGHAGQGRQDHRGVHGAPGYAITNGTMTPCVNGEFRDTWVLWSDQRGLRCAFCGDNIRSEPRDLDQNPRVANGSLVRATPTSCFIEAGQGMIARGINIFIGQDCPEDTYGAAGRVYGWVAAPCKPCPRNMITDGVSNVNNSDACINDDGFGYASEGASRCAPAFFSAKGSRRPCMACPFGRSTIDDPLGQRYVTDCLVRPGFGVVNSTANRTDAFNIDTSGLSDDAAASLNVLECPVGYYGAGGDVGSTCTKCPCGASTTATGSVSVDDCKVCLPGYGKADVNATQCGPCPYGTFQPGGSVQCTACPNANFYPPVDGVGAIYSINSTSLFNGAFGAEACVPWHSQLSPEAGQAYFVPENTAMLALTNATTRATMTDCLAACPAGLCCLAQYQVSNRTCRIATLAPVPFGANVTNGTQLHYKLPPATMGSASSLAPGAAAPPPELAAKTIASGYYAMCTVPDAQAATWRTAGTNLGPDARTFATGAAGAWDTASGSARACQRRCDESNVCWGFLFNVTTRACLYRGGVDALATRSFFVLPPAMQQNTTAECPALPLNPLGGSLPIGSAVCSSPCTSPLQCIGGVCSCPNGLTFCNNQCLNVTGDPNNCGICNGKCIPGQQCYNGVCAESVVACGSAKTFSGNEGNYTYSVTVGTAGKKFNFLYDAYSFPDRFSVYLPNGTMIFQIMSGNPGKPSPSCTCNKCMGEQTYTNGNIDLARPAGVSAVKVVVNGYCPGTQWRFVASCAK